MLNNVLYLANVTDATSRPPESAAHTNLRQNGQKNIYKKRKQKHEQSTQDRYDQQLRRAISIEVLLNFLNDVLKMRQHYTEDQGVSDQNGENTPSLFSSPAVNTVVRQVTNDNTSRVNRIHRPVHRTSEKAAKAYERAAISSQDTGSNVQNGQINAENTKALGVMDHNMKDIYAVIRDLQLLRRRGVAHLVISRSDDFIQSVMDSIAALKKA
jgi:hypothetical protein